MSRRKPRDAAPDPKNEELSPRDVTAAFNPSSFRRLLIVLSFPLILLLGVPFWWYTTSIERLPLPTARISALEGTNLSAFQHVDPRTRILLTADEGAFPKPVAGRHQYTTEDVLKHLAEQVTKSVDGLLGQAPPATRKKRLWDLAVGKGQASRKALKVHLMATDQADPEWPLKPYVQAPEEGVMSSQVKIGTLVVPVHPSKIGDPNLPTHYKMAISNAIVALFPPYLTPPDIPLRALKYARNITLSFVVLNEDSTDGSYVRSWDISKALQEHFLPHLEPLRDVFNFNIESQILYHAPLAFEPIKEVGSDTDGRPSWSLGEEEMKVFVNSEQWSLDSGSTNDPVLRFMLFVPSASHRSMQIADLTAAQSFLLPQFGAVVLSNPPDSPNSTQLHLPLSALNEPFHLFTKHLYSLLALPTIAPRIHPCPPSSPLRPPRPFMQPLTPWQLEETMRTRAYENSVEARKTLAGIVRLVSKIKEMKLGKGVRDKVLGAVERLEKMEKTHDTREAFILSRDAVIMASQAFFDPSMMGLLYFPDEHKFAVYTPLFAPIMMPVVLAVLKELMGWWRRRKVSSVQGIQEEVQAVKAVVEVEDESEAVEESVVEEETSVTDDDPTIRRRTLRSRTIVTDT